MEYLVYITLSLFSISQGHLLDGKLHIFREPDSICNQRSLIYLIKNGTYYFLICDQLRIEILFQTYQWNVFIYLFGLMHDHSAKLQHIPRHTPRLDNWIIQTKKLIILQLLCMYSVLYKSNDLLKYSLIRKSTIRSSAFFQDWIPRLES